MEWGRDSDPLLSNHVLRDSSARLARRCGTARSTAGEIPLFFGKHACIVHRAAQRVRLCVRDGLRPLPRVPVSGGRPHVSKLYGPCAYSSRAAGERCICVRRGEWPGGVERRTRQQRELSLSESSLRRSKERRALVPLFPYSFLTAKDAICSVEYSFELRVCFLFSLYPSLSVYFLLFRLSCIPNEESVKRRVSVCPIRIFILPWDGLYHHGAIGCGCDGGECAGVRCSLPGLP
ncbi:hypothetical protein B0H13DRAFT_2034199, partial [Mycena leptocephala]